LISTKDNINIKEMIRRKRQKERDDQEKASERSLKECHSQERLHLSQWVMEWWLI